MNTASTTRLTLAALLAGALAACGQAPVTPALATVVAPKPDVPREHLDAVVLGMGCFWGAERRMGALPGVIDVESGYANGEVPGTYSDVLNTERARKLGLTEKRNHAEVVKVVFDTRATNLGAVLAGFWENHDPTQGDRQGNDIGSNYRSAIYTHGDTQLRIAQATKTAFQTALAAEGYGAITTEIQPLTRYIAAEDYHQDYLVKNPDGYCGLGGTGVKFPADALAKLGGTVPTSSGPTAASAPANASPEATAARPARLVGADLDATRQLVVFEAADCAFCAKFRAEVSDGWQSPVAIVHTLDPREPEGWTLEKPLFATPTIVLFENGKEVSRYTGYNGDKARFWQWLGFRLLTEEQRRIAFDSGTERPFTGSHLDETRPGTFVDPISGAPLFRTDTKFESGTGWPSFFQPLPGAVTYHGELSLAGVMTEVRSASSGIHLGHVFHDGPPPTGKRYCINGNVLKFVPDEDVATETATTAEPVTGV
ncbi:peptide-methionine (S)-S-oxide reductase MsrA [Silanimonas sp.]|uniref:peptide-methionine (S)-S-oxide reductase MsrA n=1 Tax=Silanimonas sp. TaxID=1929290 RepID=UPI0022CB63DD|nr:peptide-methionine (S)-S-oxide reductase MsrA [Silanimonas sp.]MCZ8063894.1 peptide-methionine (S)-S-oxide reductase MsrA [Silanimonas sp.]